MHRLANPHPLPRPSLASRRRLVALGLLACLGVLGQPGPGLAQDPPPLTIRSVTMDRADGIVTIAGTGFGSNPVVTIDGQEVTVLPGATDSLLAVTAPASVLAAAGTYRLTVFDPVRRVGEVFALASRAGLVAGPAGRDAEPRPSTGERSGRETPKKTEAVPVTAPRALAPGDAGAGPLSVIEDSAGYHRTALGYQTLISNTTGDNNTALGFQAMQYNTTGGFNTAVGAQSLFLNTTGTYNTGCGLETLASNTTGNDNTAVGEWSLYWNTSGSGNTAVGLDSLVSNTTANYNTAVGRQAAFLNTTGEFLTAIGMQTLYNNTTGSYNSVLGAGAMYTNTTGSYNTGTGLKALYGNTEGWYNAASGYQALYGNTTGSSNTAMGYEALLSNTTGGSNTAVGRSAGMLATTGSYNIYLGTDVYGSDSDTNTIRIGSLYNGSKGQNRAFMAGIWGIPVTGGSPVLVDANGQLGTPGSGATLNVLDSSNTQAAQLRLGYLAGVADYGIGRNPSDGYLDFTGSQNTYSGFRFSTPGANGALTMANNGVVSIIDATNSRPYQLRLGFRSGSADYGIGRNPSDGYLNFTATQNTYSGFRFNTPNASSAVTIANNGQVGIGKALPAYPLEMASGAYVSTGGVWTNASSRTLKDRIAPVSSEAALAAVDGLVPVSFVYKADPEESHVGFIAEDVPDLVASRDRRSLAAMDVVAVVTRVVQDQRRHLTEQARQIEAQAATIAALEARLAALEAAVKK